LCVTVSDKTREPILKLSAFCPYNLERELKSLIFTQETFTQAYGLGEKFTTPGESGGDWVGQQRIPGDMGNQLEAWNGGNVGNAQFPVLYLLGEGTDNYALFVDNTYKQTWDFSGMPWRASMYGDAIRYYVLSGPDLPDLRQDFMELVGHAPVPPIQAFGLWISEYGFDNWAEVESKLRTLRENHFPVDGFVLDLQWYGGIRENSDNTREGSLTWDLRNFPDPENKITRLRDEQGVGIILIEQPYIGKNLPEHQQLEGLGYLVKQCEDCDPVYLTSNPWWGKGGMLDFTNTEATAYWHDTKREVLIDVGIVGHWTDLGEPELYDPDGWYMGVLDGQELVHGELDVHNLYNLLWSQSIYEGYVRNNDTQRPFILSRSGTVGSQRYGVAMWSGDISSLLSSLATHLRVQADMSLSGIDYFGSDIGGFLRQGINIDRTYTIWFANGMAFDVPGRVHTLNLCNCNETAPDRIGDLTSNLQNVRLRYELSPYFYSLAHRAYLFGEPFAPPAFYYYQDDPYLRDMGEEKMLGTQLLVAVETSAGKFATMVYLPAGIWVNYHTGEWIESRGELTGPIYLYPNDVFTLPIFVKAGAIIPQMFVDDQTMNIFGKRLDDTRHDESILRVYADQTPSEFTLYEDDGTTIAYQDGDVRTTLISQVQDVDSVSLSINPAQGSFTGEIEERDNFIHLYTNGLQVVDVMLNGQMLPQVENQTALDDVEIGWYDAGNGLVIARSGVMSVDLAKDFIFQVASISEH
jgi:alpha-glucosidase (family GH31 glycosyl hydrolase)